VSEAAAAVVLALVALSTLPSHGERAAGGARAPA
jgi:hypothetical protein